MRSFPSSPKPVRGSRGFTLLEVILAVAIAAGVLVGILAFYQQTANLRNQLLGEADRLATLRLLLDRITLDLRSARVEPESGQGLTGTESALQVVRVELPPASAWAAKASSRTALPFTDLRLVKYEASTHAQGTNLVIAGLVRTEQPMVQQRIEVAPRQAAAPSSKENPAETEAKKPVEPLTDAIGYLYFRYWDGSEWVKTWSDACLPKGVEINFGLDPAAPGTVPEDYPFELFRRVVYLPGSAVISDALTERSILEDLGFGPEEMP